MFGGPLVNIMSKVSKIWKYETFQISTSSKKILTRNPIACTDTFRLFTLSEILSDPSPTSSLDFSLSH